MKLHIEVRIKATFYTKTELVPLKIDKTIAREFDEDSEEYKQLCFDNKAYIGFDREEDADKFDKELLQILCQNIVSEWNEKLDRIQKVVKACYKDGATAYIELAGYIINPNDFCAVEFENIEPKISKH